MGLQEASLPLDGGSLGVDIHLETLFTVKGTTINAATAEALPSVRVLAQPWRAEGCRSLFLDALTQTATSGEGGAFALMLPEGHWVITGEAVGFSSMRSPEGWNVVVSESRGVEPTWIVVELCPHAALFGTVFNSSGNPAPKAKVTVDPGFLYWADDQGRYKTDLLRPVFTGYARDPEFRVKAEWNDESASGFCTFRLARDGGRDVKSPLGSYTDLLRGALPLDLHLQASTPELSRAIIVGTVLDEDGKPASSAEVELAEPPTWPHESMFYAVPLKKTMSDSEGEFEFSCLDRGLWLIRARKKAVDTQGNAALFLGEKWQTLVEDAPPWRRAGQTEESVHSGQSHEGERCSGEKPLFGFLPYVKYGADNEDRTVPRRKRRIHFVSLAASSAHSTSIKPNVQSMGGEKLAAPYWRQGYYAIGKGRHPRGRVCQVVCAFSRLWKSQLGRCSVG
jgi:hypothetical protein